MSLIKSFNFNFLKQNIKKSKGAIILSLIIVPLIISMYLVVYGLELHTPEVVPTTTIGVIDIIFMYIIPFVYSALLFGFVFKKTSTDFMNSMPINRKTMFITNTIGGILLITLIQLLSGFFALLWGAVFKNLIIFPSAVLDIMIVSWISYVFVFIASNLAMTFSGTHQAHFITAVLILFLVPVCVELIGSIRKYETYKNMEYNSSVYSYGYNYDLSIVDGYQTTYYRTLENIKDYTMPFKLFRYGLQYSWESNLRMIGLSILYFVLGLKLYQRRKMEHSEETYESQKMHIFVKSLTLIPILLVVDRMNVYSESITGLIIAIIFCAIYYFIFDIISKRKIPFATTVASFAVTVFVIQAMTTFLGNIEYRQSDVDADDIKSISIGKNSNSSCLYYYFVNDSEYAFDGDYFIKDNQILELILDGRYKVLDPTTAFLDKGGYVSKDIYFNIKLKNGKEYYIETSIANKNYNEIISILSRNEEYNEHMKKQIIKKNGIIQIGNDVVDNNTKRKIEKLMSQEDINIFSSNTNSVNYITKTVYQGHKIVKYQIPLNNNEELLAVVADFANKQVLENIKGYQYNISVDVYDKSSSIGHYYGDSEILDFIELHSADEFDSSKKYYVLYGGLQTRNGYKNFVFYTNSTKELDKILENSTSSKYYW